MTSRLLAVIAVLLFAGACELPGSQQGCNSMAITWVNFIEVGSTEYFWGTVSRTMLQESDLGPVYAHVKFTVSDNVCDQSYQPKDGDAAFLQPGTTIYQVRGQPPSEQLAARFNGHILLYLAVREAPPPPPGSAPPP